MEPPLSSSFAKAYDLMRAGRLEEAIVIAEKQTSGASRCTPAHGFLGALYLKVGRASDAERIVSTALQLAPGVADSYDGLAYVSAALGSYERANQLYRRATELAPQVPRFWYNLAGSERSMGRLINAESACNKAIALDPSAYATYLLRSELRVQSRSENHLEELRAHLARPNLEHHGRVFLGYALGKELDDVGEFDEAFRWFSAAAKARRSRLDYDVATDESKLKRIAQAFPKITQPALAADDTSRYIFILGLPRSGTTLLERILTGLPNVRSNGETENFSHALLGAARGPGDIFQRAAAADGAVVAREYARFAEMHGSQGRIIEKLPMNYLYVGAIRNCLPNAKLLWVRRSPIDSCFAMFRTLFGDAYPFSYDFNDLGRYYVAYEHLMGHWKTLLGAELHEVIYEDLVRTPREVGRAIADHCGIEWQDAALEIQNNQSVSLTASAAQVRRPIYGSSSGRWQHYQYHLHGLIRELESRGIGTLDYARRMPPNSD